MKPSILFLKFPYSSSFGGGELHTLQICDALVKHGIPFYLLSSCPVLLAKFREKTYTAKKLSLGKDPVSKVSILSFLFRLPYIVCVLFFFLLYYKTSKNVSIIYCLTLTEKLIGAPIANILGMKVIFMEHTSIERWLTKNPYRFLYKWWASFSTIICVSESVKQECVAFGIPQQRILVIYNGVDTNVFKPLLSQDISDNIYIKSLNMFTVGTVARLDEEKGIVTLIQATKIAYEYIPNLRVLIIGTGAQKEKLTWLAKHLEVEHIVQFVGFKDNVAIWLRNLDVFVLPSIKRESFGLSAAEAMACGIPVIASRIGGIPELVKQNQNGVLINPGDTNQLASVLIHLSQEPTQVLKMGQYARKHIEDHFTLDKMIIQYLDVFKSHE